MARVVGGVEIEIRGDDAHFERTMRDVRAEAGRTGQTMTREFRGAGNEAGRLRTQIAGTTSAFIGLAAVVTTAALAGPITQAADQFAQMRSKINLSISAADDLLAVEKQLYQQAVANRAALEPVVSLYQRIRGSRADLSNTDTLEVTDRFSKSLVISGASAQGAASATLQFSQAIAGGVLRAEEFNSIIESNVRFVKLLADNLGVTVGEIRGLVNEGAITSDVIFKAIRENGADLDAEFAKIPVTVNSALTNLSNAFTSYIGLSDQASGTSARLAGFINSLAQDFDRLAEVVLVTSAVIGGAFGASAALAATRALAGIAIGATAAAQAMSVLRLASAFMLGPAGFVIAIATLTGGLAALAISARNSSAEFEQLRTAATEAGSALQSFNQQGSSTVLQQQAIDLSKIKEEYYGIAAAAAVAAEAEKARRVNALIGERAEVARALEALEERRGNRNLNRLGNAGQRQQLDEDIAKARELLNEYEQAIAATAAQRIPDIAREIATSTVAPAATAAQTTATSDLADETKRLAAAQAELNDLLDEADGVVARVRTERDAATLQRVDEFNLLKAERDREAQKIADAAQEIQDRIASSIARGLEEGVRSGNWGEALRGILATSVSDALSEAINDLAGELVNIFSGLFSGGGLDLGSLFGGGRAGGGTVRAGMRYMVGEQGPEMFVPSVPGMIVPRFEGPASAAAGGVQGRAGITIAAPFIVQGSITEEVLPRVQAMMAAQARELPRIVDSRVSDSLRRGRYK